MSTSSNQRSNVDEVTAAFSSFEIPKTHITVGVANSLACHRQYRTLLTHGRLPDHGGWSDVQIQHFLLTLSTLDTNNPTAVALAVNDENEDSSASSSSRWCGVGEREGRVFSTMVQQRHYGFSHGIGRSGDITEPQPKAVGSTVLVKLTTSLTLDAMRRGAGLHPTTTAVQAIVLPLCTGMSMSLVLSSFRSLEFPSKSVVLWSRIDQKSCYKAITSAGLQCIVVPTRLDAESDSVVTDVAAMEQALLQYNNQVLAVITTSSCFAPRVPDAVDRVAQLCHQYQVRHVINHAYGLQCPSTNKLLNRACVVGRVDAIVCSLDKNFLVPVGGAVVVSPSASVIGEIGKIYAGRASAAPVLDLFITLMSMGLSGYRRLLQQRVKHTSTFANELEIIARKHGERCLVCPTNTISFGMTLDGLVRQRNVDGNETEEEYAKAVSRELTSLGAMLFTRCVSGTRVIPRRDRKTIGTNQFDGFGSSVTGFPHSYLTAACAIGLSNEELLEFFSRLNRTLEEFKKKQRRSLHTPYSSVANPS